MAIALDTSLDLGFSFSGSKTTSFTTSGSNRLLFVGGWGAVGSDNWTGVTYNGVSMTRIDTSLVSGD